MLTPRGNSAGSFSGFCVSSIPSLLRMNVLLKIEKHRLPEARIEHYIPEFDKTNSSMAQDQQKCLSGKLFN